MMTDPISDMLNQIKNAQAVSKSSITLPTSKFKEAILEVLKAKNYIKDFSSKEQVLTIKLNYINGRPAINKIKKISKPGLRIYANSKRIPNVMQGFGEVIVSTSAGIMTGKNALGKNLGGEVICEIY